MKRYAMITGASSGLGAEFARQLSDMGYSLILAARREERLQKLREDILCLHPELDVKYLCADLSEKAACLRLMQLTENESIEILINNAGFGDCGSFAESDLDKELDMIDVNVCALHILTKCMLQKMERQGHGKILNVASSAGLIPAGPYMSTYYASKAYAASLTRAIAQELKERKSRVYLGVLCPGPVDTEFNEVANVRFALKGITPELCVREAINGMQKRRTVIVPTAKMQTVVTLGRFLPQNLYIRLTGMQQKKKFQR